MTSPLMRARQTAAPSPGRSTCRSGSDEALTETDFGGWEGLTFTEAAEQRPPVHAPGWATAASARPAGRASPTSGPVADGAGGDSWRRTRAQTVVVVSHVTPIKLVLRARWRRPGAPYRLHLDLACLSVADF